MLRISYILGATVALLMTASWLQAQPAGGPPVSLPALEAQVTALTAQVAALQATVTTLQNQLANAQHILALDPFVSVDPNPKDGLIGPHIIFTGANIHIVNGLSSTTNGNGLGNLIIGYDEIVTPLVSGDRAGSHNLVIGSGHRFTAGALGGFVAGWDNRISNTAASVLAGYVNTASGYGASVLGGNGNAAYGSGASVLGGESNVANGNGSSIVSGVNNVTNGALVAILGGSDNTSYGFSSVVLGGNFITGAGQFSIVPNPLPAHFP